MIWSVALDKLHELAELDNQKRLFTDALGAAVEALRGVCARGPADGRPITGLEVADGSSR